MILKQTEEFIPITITLETEEEVRALYTILCATGGDPKKSPRKHTDKIFNYMNKLKIRNLQYNGTITFLNNEV